MNSTSLTPTSLSVPPDFGVPGLSAWLPPVRDDDADADVDGPPEPPLDVELLHAAASTVRATTAVAAPMARNRKCLTTLLLLQNLPAKVVRRMGYRRRLPRGADCRAHPSDPAVGLG